MSKLTPRQQAFADYYIELGNAEQAAIKAGYSERYARGNAYKLVADSGIKKYIDARLAEKDKERIASQDEVLQFLTDVLRGEVQEQVPLGIGMGAQKLVMKEIGGKDRIKAAELLAKRYGLLKDNVNIDGNLGVTIVDDIGSDEDGES
jgi:phage terminase small subunit